jgi:hypothetical protein
MFLGKLNVGMVLLAAILLFSACTPTGGIVILENPNGTGFTMNQTKFHGTNKCQLSLAAGDVLQVEVSRSGGEMGLVISGMRGSEPYAGSSLPARIFTIGISETDEYVFRVSGENATGRITVKNLGKKAE